MYVEPNDYCFVFVVLRAQFLAASLDSLVAIGSIYSFDGDGWSPILSISSLIYLTCCTLQSHILLPHYLVTFFLCYRREQQLYL